MSLRNHPVGTISLGLSFNRSQIFGHRDASESKKIPDQKNGPAILSKSLSLNLVPPPKVDLIHDDWYGLAPLASPESLSEISSISSRTSLVPAHVVVDVCQTPKFMRRTPKIIGSLSTCAEDVRNLQNFATSKVFPRLFINNNNLQESSSSSNLSFESASSSNNRCCSGSTANMSRSIESGCNKISEIKEVFARSDSEFQSAEDILDNVLVSAGCKEFFNSESNFLETHLDLLQEGSPPPAYFRCSSNTPVYPQLMSPSSPQELDSDIVSNLAIDLSLDGGNRSIQFSKASPAPDSSIDSGSVCRTPSDSHKNVTFNPQVITVDSIPCDLRYSPPIRWRLFKGKTSKSKNTSKKSSTDCQTVPPSIPPAAPNPGAAAPLKTILSMKSKRTSSSGLSEDSTDRQTDECFSRTEQLPLLSDLSYASSDLRNTSPSYVRRKNYTVYPADVVVVTKNSEKLGSSGHNFPNVPSATGQFSSDEREKPEETSGGKMPPPTESAV